MKIQEAMKRIKIELSQNERKNIMLMNNYHKEVLKVLLVKEERYDSQLTELSEKFSDL